MESVTVTWPRRFHQIALIRTATDFELLNLELVSSLWPEGVTLLILG